MPCFTLCDKLLVLLRTKQVQYTNRAKEQTRRHFHAKTNQSFLLRNFQLCANPSSS
uniref:Uncharacterized protein n=1 Tax=Utricularia reniformis TaxID=192314 RepID=A0A1Y0B4V5_9LAMI|nr:hypothetical protein AEK19_MT2279 [Utricularia reniformis]ART32424.1 hypothetical protein AEK19_MT2279 [Utricularia reniformis]